MLLLKSGRLGENDFEGGAPIHLGLQSEHLTIAPAGQDAGRLGRAQDSFFTAALQHNLWVLVLGEQILDQPCIEARLVPCTDQNQIAQLLDNFLGRTLSDVLLSDLFFFLG